MTLRTLALASLSLLAATSVAGEDWPHWRGVARNDVTAESSGWSGNDWLAKEPAWSADVGAGGTSPIVVGDRLYVLGWRDNRDTLHCLDAASGKAIWAESFPARQYGRHATGDEGFYFGPSATPEFDPATGQLYTLSLDGDLRAWDAGTGKSLWVVNLYDQYQVEQRPKVSRAGRRDYGYTAAPLAHRDWVIVEVGDDEGTLMAFHRRDGRRVWASQHREPAGHSGGLVPLVVEGVPCLAVLTLYGLLVARLDEPRAGQTVAEYPWATDFANNIPTPAVAGNEVLITSDYNQLAACKLRISLAGAEKVWEVPVSSGVCSPVIHDGRVYWAHGPVRCLDWETGQVVWGHGNFDVDCSCFITRDDRLAIVSQRGAITLAETAQRSPERYTELARREAIFPDFSWPHAVLAGGRLYVKDRQGHLVCYETLAGKK